MIDIDGEVQLSPFVFERQETDIHETTTRRHDDRREVMMLQMTREWEKTTDDDSIVFLSQPKVVEGEERS